VGSALQGNRRIVFVITGLDSDRARAEEAERIVNWAFRQFVLRRVVEEGTRIAEAPVWMGGAATVGLVADGPVDLLVPLVGASATTAEVRFTGPLEAPVVAGAQVAELVVRVPELPPETVPLFAAEDVPRGGFTTRLGVAANRLLGMVLGPADAAPQP
jgi:D-alanyl-D-alanine carboxypeptidase (penicillin-binding protein 5/6)